MKTVTRLALTRIRAKKSRSAVICVAILLTMILFMTVVSISVNMLTGYSLMLRLASGTDYHGYLRTATFTLSGEALRDKVRTSEDIAEAVISSNVATYALQEADVPSSYRTIRAMEKAADLAHFYTDITEGRFPEADDEILVNPQYFPDVAVGDTVGLYYTKRTEYGGETAYATFTVSGMMHSRTDTQLPLVMRYSDTLIDAYGFTGQSANVYVLFNSSRHLTEQYERLVNETLAADRREGYDKHGALNAAYLETVAKEVLTPATVFLILFSVAVVFLCSFLLIVNVYSIALTQDMQAFGLLSVIGTTHRQLRRMIATESLVLFAVTVPVGLIGGYLIGWKMLSPILFSSLQYEGVTFSFSLWIPCMTLALTLFTLLWSATRPLKKLRAMTPIATVDYSPSTDLPKYYIRRKNYAPRNVTPTGRRLAAYSISRNRKKTLLTALSMSLSVILFVLIATLCDYVITYTEQNLQLTDYILKLQYTYRWENSEEEKTGLFDADKGVGLSEETVSRLKQVATAAQSWRIRVSMTQIPTPPSVVEELRVLREEYTWFDHYPQLTQALDGKLDVLVVSIPDDLFPLILQNEQEAFGETAVGSVIWKQNSIVTTDPANPRTLYHFAAEDTVRLGDTSYPILSSTATNPVTRIADYIAARIHRAVIYMAESAFTEEFGEGITYAVLLNAQEGCYDSLRAELEAAQEPCTLTVDEALFEKMTAEEESLYTSKEEILSYSVDISGRMDGMEQMREIVLSIQTVGYSLSAMIFLVGVLNIVNTSLSSVSARKRELAMLEAVGMSDRQMLRMLLLESLCGSAVATAIAVFLGFPLVALIISLSMDNLVRLDWVLGVTMLVVCALVSMASAAATFVLTKSVSVVERIQVI